MLKKIIACAALVAAIIMGGQFADINQAEAADVWVCSNSRYDYYIPTERIRYGRPNTADYDVIVYVKMVNKSGQLDECTGFWFDKDKGEWWYGMYEPKSERSFRVYSPSTDAPIKATLNWILNNR